MTGPVAPTPRAGRGRWQALGFVEVPDGRLLLAEAGALDGVSEFDTLRTVAALAQVVVPVASARLWVFVYWPVAAAGRSVRPGELVFLAPPGPPGPREPVRWLPGAGGRPAFPVLGRVGAGCGTRVAGCADALRRLAGESPAGPPRVLACGAVTVPSGTAAGGFPVFARLSGGTALEVRVRFAPGLAGGAAGGLGALGGGGDEAGDGVVDGDAVYDEDPDRSF